MEYGHLTLEERTVIMIYVREGQGPAETARRLGRALSTIRRELARHRRAPKMFTEDVRRVEDLYNHRPRKCLGYRTPAEALQDELQRT